MSMTESDLRYETSRAVDTSAGTPRRQLPQMSESLATEGLGERPVTMDQSYNNPRRGQPYSDARAYAQPRRQKDRYKKERAQYSEGSKGPNGHPGTTTNSDGAPPVKKQRKRARPLQDFPSEDRNNTKDGGILDPFAHMLESLQAGEIRHEAGEQNSGVYVEETLPRSGSVRSTHQPLSRRMSAYSSASQSPRLGPQAPDSGWSSNTSLMKRSGSAHRARDGSPPPVPPLPSTVPTKMPPHLLSDEKKQPNVPNPKDVSALETSEFKGPGTTRYPATARAVVVLISLYISLFLVALDRTIIGPAIPIISNQFHSMSDIGWYGSAYMVTSCGFMLFYGQLYKYFATKMVFLSSIILFEAGSTICAKAPSSLILIIGRAVAGLGSSGITTGTQVIIAKTLPLNKRPLAVGLFGAVFGIASVAGPLLGGIFTSSSLTWRWCFWMNLPVGGMAILMVIAFCPLGSQQRTMTWKRTLLHLDPLGTILFLPSLVCLLIVLEWTGSDYSWDDPHVIGLLLGFGIGCLLFVGWQYKTRKTTATIKSKVIFQRSMGIGCISQFTVGAGMLTCSLFIPLWFQAIKNWGAMHSGFGTIPLVGSVVLGAVISGGLVQKLGIYTPFMLIGSAMMAIGAGLITTWKVDTGIARWLGYQVIFGFGTGLTMQQPMLAAQTVLSMEDLPSGTALLTLCQTMGGAVFASVGENTFIHRFLIELRRLNVDHPERLIKTGATSMKEAITPGQEGAVQSAYNTGLTKGPFFAALIVICFGFPAACFMEWRSTKKKDATGLPPPEHRAIDEKGRRSQSEPIDPSASESFIPPDIPLEKKKTPPRLPTPSGTSSGIPSRTPSHATSHTPSRQKSLRKSLPDASRSLAKKLNPDLRDELVKRDPPEGFF